MCSNCPDVTCMCTSGWTDPLQPDTTVCGYDSSQSHPDKPGCPDCDSQHASASSD